MTLDVYYCTVCEEDFAVKKEKDPQFVLSAKVRSLGVTIQRRENNASITSETIVKSSDKWYSENFN